MATLSLYFIRHIPTGFYLPNPTGSHGRGGSHMEPADPALQPPRIFRNERSARTALFQWLRGKHVGGQTFFDSFTGEYWEKPAQVVPQKDRRKADMEIVKRVIEL